MAFLSRWEKVLVLLGASVLLLLAWVYGYRLGYLSVANPQTEIRLEGEEASPSRPQTILVHVAGAVKRPGVYQLSQGARVKDAILKAGGAKEGADIHALNLAEFLQDGQKVTVPLKRLLARKGLSQPGEQPSEVVKVNVNTASVRELELLPGIGPSLAERIVRHREAHGPFTRPEDLLEVRGIGPKKLEQMKPFIEF